MLIERERARIKKRPTTKAACCCGNQKNIYIHTHTNTDLLRKGGHVRANYLKLKPIT